MLHITKSYEQAKDFATIKYNVMSISIWLDPIVQVNAQHLNIMLHRNYRVGWCHHLALVHIQSNFKNIHANILLDWLLCSTFTKLKMKSVLYHWKNGKGSKSVKKACTWHYYRYLLLALFVLVFVWNIFLLDYG